MLALVLLLRLASSTPPTASPLSFTLRIEGEKTLRATLSGPEADLPAGEFRGSVSLNGSAAQLPLSGTVAHADGRWKLPLTVRYADVPADWAERFHTDTFTYRLRGNVGGAPPREWTGTRPWKDIEVESDKESGAEFLKLEDVRLTEFSLLSSEAAAQIAVRNPFAFPLKIAETQYTLFVEGHEVGEGATRGMILHGGQNNTLTLPIEIDHASLLSAAGKALVGGGEVRVQLHGKLVVRLTGGDLTVPLELSGHLSGGS